MYDLMCISTIFLSILCVVVFIIMLIIDNYGKNEKLVEEWKRFKNLLDEYEKLKKELHETKCKLSIFRLRLSDAILENENIRREANMRLSERMIENNYLDSHIETLMALRRNGIK